jgi:hypothetical protein
VPIIYIYIEVSFPWRGIMFMATKEEEEEEEEEGDGKLPKREGKAK